MERLEETIANGRGYFGVCPTCGGEDGYLNVGPLHFIVCDAHKAKWAIGSNLFSSWKDEPESLHIDNARLLSGYQDVAPYHHETPEPAPESETPKAWQF